MAKKKNRAEKRYASSPKKKRAKRRYRSNPDDGGAEPIEKAASELGGEMMETILPGFLAFAATRLLTRVAALQIAKRWPRAAPHAGALASIGSFAAAWFAGHKLPLVRDYQNPVVMGSAIAAGQSLIQIYVPKLGWVVSDAGQDVKAATQQQLAAAPAQQSQQNQPMLDPNYEDIDSGGWFHYNDAQDAGRYAGQRPQNAQRETGAQDATSQADDDIFDMLDDASEAQGAGGVFS